MNHLPTNPTLGDIVRAGALGRTLRKIVQGWREDAILIYIEASYPGATPAQYREILLLAQRARNAAGLQARLDAGERIKLTDIPLIPPGA